MQNSDIIRREIGTLTNVKLTNAFPQLGTLESEAQGLRDQGVSVEQPENPFKRSNWVDPFADLRGKK